MYSDVLTCLTRDPLAGNVSPSLIGTQGTIPLSVVSTIPDIMQHYHDCSASPSSPPIALSSQLLTRPSTPSSRSRPRREGGLPSHECVSFSPSQASMFGTDSAVDPLADYWQCVVRRRDPALSNAVLTPDFTCRPSDSVKKVAEGLVELDRRVGERKGARIVVKVMWDRGAVQQLWQCVPPPSSSLAGRPFSSSLVLCAATTSRSSRRPGHRSACRTRRTSPTCRSRSSTSTVPCSARFTRSRSSSTARSPSSTLTTSRTDQTSRCAPRLPHSLARLGPGADQASRPARR